MRGLSPHQDAHLVKLLPFAVERQKGTDLEMACGYIEGTCYLCPLFKVTERRPSRFTIVDDEEMAPLRLLVHKFPPHRFRAADRMTSDPLINSGFCETVALLRRPLRN